MPDPINPLLSLHRQQPEVEFQPYDRLEIVSTFGQPQAEYAALRKGCGLVDLPQRGLLELTGNDRHAFLNNLVSNQVWDKQTRSGLAAGSGVYALFLNLRGRIVADMNVLETGERLLVEADVRKVDLLRATWDRYLFTEQVKLIDRSDSLHEIALHGPTALRLLREATGQVLELGPLASLQGRIEDVDVLVWRDDVCGVPGYHLVTATAEAERIWSFLLQRFGTPSDLGRRELRPVGWAAFNATRIEAGRPLLDIDFPAAAPDRPGVKLQGDEPDETSEPAAAGILPAELGPQAFARAVNLSKCYVGQEVVARMHARKQVARMIVGVRMSDDALPIAGAKVFDEQSNEVGIVTSSTISPLLSNAAICLAYLKRPFFETGKNLLIPAEGQMRAGSVVEMPFVQL